jgi:hypothetical protein
MEKRKRVYTYVFFFVNNSTEDTAFACKVGKGTGKRAESHKTTFPGYIAGWLPFDCESDLLMLFGVWSERLDEYRPQEVFKRCSRIDQFVLTRMNRWRREADSITKESVERLVGKAKPSVPVEVKASVEVPDRERKKTLSRKKEQVEPKMSASQTTPVVERIGVVGGKEESTFDGPVTSATKR